MKFSEKLKAWRPDLSLKEKAALLNLEYPYVRKYACGKRTPGKLARCEIERRMEANKL